MYCADDEEYENLLHTSSNVIHIGSNHYDDKEARATCEIYCDPNTCDAGQVYRLAGMHSVVL